jgi:hypothetical protein
VGRAADFYSLLAAGIDAAAVGRRRRFFLVIPVRGDDGARAIGAIDADDAAARRRRWTAISYGVIDNRSENLQH